MDRCARSLLFVPGHRPERFAKALASGADLVCIDLEDAVPLQEKVSAREAVRAFLATCSQADLQRLVIRVSAANGEHCNLDLKVLADCPRPAFFMLAKTESPQQLSYVSAALATGPQRWIGLIESPRGLLNADAICASQALSAVMFGGGDYAAELGATFAWEPLLIARSQLAMVAAAHNLPCIDVPYLDIQNPAGLSEETRRVCALGYSAKAAIHPCQLEAIHLALAPTEAEVQGAKKIIDAFVAADGGAVTVDGRMVDQPIVESARRLLARVANVVSNVEKTETVE
ncbi:CoA ester lyase [Microbulbifer sp. ALW1]|uniref:HpcH/HpaI aldolase/citrate lyase family protein n=1 Tax=Microbulbifer sp. (strain ALW1) TaxID=1516059 RepID=UPI00135AFDB3|nr:CoA ester lyase [Microbulbifer sp. ALW1]